jgi:hypothetical protein
MPYDRFGLFLFFCFEQFLFCFVWFVIVYINELVAPPKNHVLPKIFNIYQNQFANLTAAIRSTYDTRKFNCSEVAVRGLLTLAMTKCITACGN